MDDVVYTPFAKGSQFFFRAERGWTDLLKKRGQPESVSTQRKGGDKFDGKKLLNIISGARLLS